MLFFSVGCSPLSWKTKKQYTVSQSSTEVVYRSMAITLCKLKFLSYLLQDFLVPVSRSIPLHSNSQATIYIASNLVFHERTKHIEINCHFIRVPSSLVLSLLNTFAASCNLLT